MRVNENMALCPSILTPHIIFRFIINEVAVKIFVLTCGIMSYITHIRSSLTFSYLPFRVKNRTWLYWITTQIRYTTGSRRVKILCAHECVCVGWNVFKTCHGDTTCGVRNNPEYRPASIGIPTTSDTMQRLQAGNLYFKIIFSQYIWHVRGEYRRSFYTGGLGQTRRGV